MLKPYQYYPGERGHQYDDLDLTVSKIVDARYSESAVQFCKGNPFIEALPWPRTQEEVRTAYQRSIPYSPTHAKSLSPEEIWMNLDTLAELRFPLPFHYELEQMFFNVLMTSYRNRKSKFSSHTVTSIHTEDRITDSHHQLIGNPASAANTGLALLGYSGCGKSSSFEVLLGHYPQVIYHYDEHGGRYPQIVYLALNCVPNSNFSALYARIGEAIDRALNLDEPVYQHMVEKRRSLGEKSSCIRRLIEIFSIGAIILDEIQLIDFNSTKENSFESLLLLTNETKVAFIVIGTEDAYSKMFTESRTARRIGKVISGNAYCENYQYFSHMLVALFQYQWFEESIKLTPEIAKALYELSHGIVHFIINAYIEMHRAYYSETPRPQINGTFIRHTVGPRMERLHMLMQDAITQNAMNPELDVDLYFDEQQQAAFSQEYLESCKDADRLRENVFRNIAAIVGSSYNLSTVSDAYSKVIARPKQKKEELALTKAVMKMLKRHPDTSQKKALTPVSLAEMRACLLDSAPETKKDASP